MNNQNLKHFNKGQSGNLSGRPVGSKNRSTTINYWLNVETEYLNPLTDTNEKLSILDQITIQLILKAKKGDVQAYKELLDGAYGKVKDVVENIKAIESPDSFEIIIIDERTKNHETMKQLQSADNQ